MGECHEVRLNEDRAKILPRGDGLAAGPRRGRLRRQQHLEHPGGGQLSFLGLGIPLPEPSWGSMIAYGQQTISASPDLVLIPSAFLFATVVSLNVLGDALRERWANPMGQSR